MLSLVPLGEAILAKPVDLLRGTLDMTAPEEL
jgi:hypothetical protein